MKFFLLLSIFSIQVIAQTICHSVYRANIGRSQSNNLKVLEQLNRVDGTIALLNRQLRKGEVFHPTYLQSKIDADFLKIEKSFLKGDYQAPVVQIRKLYSRVETSYLRVLQFNRFSRVLREAHQMGIVKVEPLLKQNEVVDYLIDMYAGRISSLDDISRILREVEDNLVKDIRILGKNFQRYDEYRSNLNVLKKADFCSSACKIAIKELKKNVSVMNGARRNMVNDFIGSEVSITRNKVRTLVHSHPEAILIQRKRELLYEGVALLKRFVSKFGLLRKLTNYLATNVSPQSRRLYRMLRSVFDERYLANHSRGIERIVNSELSATQKYNLMKNEVKDLDEKMFWVDLSRTNSSKANKAWQEIKDQAQRKGLTDELAAMEDAQRIGEILGSPRNRNIRNAIRIVSTLALVGGSIAYFSFDTEDDDTDDDSGDVLIDLDNGNVIDTSNGNPVDLNTGNEVNTNNGNDVDTNNGNETNSNEDDETTVLIDYLSPEDQEIEELMLDLISIDKELSTEKDSPQAN